MLPNVWGLLGGGSKNCIHYYNNMCVCLYHKLSGMFADISCEPESVRIEFLSLGLTFAYCYLYCATSLTPQQTRGGKTAFACLNTAMNARLEKLHTNFCVRTAPANPSWADLRLMYAGPIGREVRL